MNNQQSKQHERDNGCVLHLCGDNCNPKPQETIWGENYVMWYSRIFNEVRNNFDARNWDAAEKEARTKTGLEDDVKRKNPLLISATLEVLWEQERRSTLLDRLCNSILKYAKDVDQEE